MPLDLAKIGRLLKTTREERGLSLEEASDRLFIRKATLGAIESGDWERLPHQVYVRGYIAQYASFLGVLGIVRADLSPTEGGPVQNERRKSPGRHEAMPMGRSLKKRILGIGATAAVLFAFVIFLNVQRPPHIARTPHQVISRNLPPAGAGNAGTSYNRQEVPNNQQEDKTAYRAAGDSYQSVAGRDRSEGSYDRQQDKLVLTPKKLMIACQERTWVAIVIDGSERKEFTLNPEEVVVLNANEKFDLLIGNAGGVKLYYNGKDVGFTGESGQVKRITLS